MRKLMLLVAAMSYPAAPQTLVDLRTQAKSIDFTAATSTKPLKTGSVLPATCSIGALFYKSDAAPGQNLYGCTALNVWTQMSGGGNVNTGVVNTFTRGQVIAGQQDQVQLDITGNSAQTSPLLRVRTAAGANLVQANQDGSVNLGTGTGPMVLTGNSGAAPSTPASGQTSLYYSATAKLAQTVDDDGNHATMVRPNACAGQVVQSIGADGAVTCGAGGGGGPAFSTGQGFYAPWGFGKGDTQVNSNNYIALAQFVVPYAMPVSKIVLYNIGNPGGAGKGLALALYSGAPPNLTRVANAYGNLTPPMPQGAVTVSLSASVPLAAGIYYFGWFSEDSSSGIQLLTADPVPNFFTNALNPGTEKRFGLSTNTPTGTGATLALPATLTAFTAGYYKTLATVFVP